MDDQHLRLASIYSQMKAAPREMAVGPGLLAVGGGGAQEPLALARSNRWFGRPPVGPAGCQLLPAGPQQLYCLAHVVPGQS